MEQGIIKVWYDDKYKNDEGVDIMQDTRKINIKIDGKIMNR